MERTGTNGDGAGRRAAPPRPVAPKSGAPKSGAPKELTDQELAALRFVRAYRAENGYPPSYREVGEHVGIRPANNANRLVRRLLDAGHLTVEEAPGGPNGRRGPVRALNIVVPDDDIFLPYRGKVSCGTGCENDEEFEHAPVNIADIFRRTDLAVYEATGDSMRDALIAPGDILLVRENPDPPVGSKVIAMFDRDLVCKKLAKRSASRVRLESCSAGYEPIEFNPARLPSFRILGILYTVIRRC